VSYLKTQHGADAAAATTWMCHWMQQGFTALEALITDDAVFSFADQPDLSDLCLVAQCDNAHRWGLDLAPLPKIQRVEAACLANPAIVASHPDKQPDAKI
jgi:maleylacetoacetate isomerase/maleylpyruvate isomerase